METPGIRTGLFLQVRLDSTRLYKKALLPLKNGNVIEHVMRALRMVKADVYALLTNQSSVEQLSTFAEKEGFTVFVGPDSDVLKRYWMAAKHHGVDIIIRATGDNPLVSAAMCTQILKIHVEKSADLSHFLGLPLGTGVEVVSKEALNRMHREAKDSSEREHMTTYIYRNRKSFKVVEQTCPKRYFFPDAKVSLDTEDDYRLIVNIFYDLYRSKPIEIGSLVRWLRRYYFDKEGTILSCRGKGNGNRAYNALSFS
jgi:spore coat polysaccharide biosynthesis protein SpsF